MTKKTLTGKIVSNRMQKTVVVEVPRIRRYPKYKRIIIRQKKYKAHIESGEYQIGDKVIIEECRPISKDKKWKVIKKIASQFGEGAGEPTGSSV